MIEIEAKFKVADSRVVQRRLELLKACSCGKEQEEKDFVYDTPGHDFLRAGNLVRLRRLGKGCLVTFKGAVMPGRFKKRAEVNLPCTDAKQADAFLSSLGLQGHFSKEKKRRQWRYKQCLVCLDRLPCLGSFVEIEGKPAAIVAAARSLGLDPQSALKDSYESLFSLFCLQRSVRAPAAFKKPEFSFRFEKLLRKKGLL